MGLRRKRATNYVEISDSDDGDDFVDPTTAEDEALNGWGASRQKKKKTNAKEKFLARDLEQYHGKDPKTPERPTESTPAKSDIDDEVSPDRSVATASPPKSDQTVSPEISEPADNETPARSEVQVPSSPEPTPPRRRNSGGKPGRSKSDDDDDDFDIGNADICVEDSDDDFQDDPDESDFELEEPAPKKKKKSAPAPKKKKPAKSPARVVSKPTKTAKSTKSPGRPTSLKPAKVGLKPSVSRKPIKISGGGGSALPGLRPRGRQIVLPTGPPKSIAPLRLNGAPRRRSGLSRLEKVPRLHKYLKDD